MRMLAVIASLLLVACVGTAPARRSMPRPMAVAARPEASPPTTIAEVAPSPPVESGAAAAATAEPAAVEPAAVEPAAVEPAAPAEPDPHEKLADTIREVDDDLDSIDAQPFGVWSDWLGRLKEHDGGLRSLAEQLPDARPRLKRIRQELGELRVAIQDGRKKEAKRALDRVRGDL
jgi:hypothetical protein